MSKFNENNRIVLDDINLDDNNDYDDEIDRSFDYSPADFMDNESDNMNDNDMDRSFDYSPADFMTDNINDKNSLTDRLSALEVRVSFLENKLSSEKNYHNLGGKVKRRRGTKKRKGKTSKGTKRRKH